MNREEKKIRELRESYERATLSPHEVDTDPLVQFHKWFDSALDAKITEVNAMTLATVNNEGQPSARIVLLKEVADGGFVFFTNYGSRKANEIVDSEKVSLLFFWKELEQQIRIEGQAMKIDKTQSEDYFQSRPKGSQIGAWASPQSHRISREDLEKNVEKIAEKHINDNVLPLPDNWGGYIVIPHYYEFWQGRQNRLHDRIVYHKLDQDKWEIYRIAP
jgi:pyridoxamine 5'-phosphate oxidase